MPVFRKGIYFGSCYFFTVASDIHRCGTRCCLNFYESWDGSCLECPLGTHGVNCSGECVLGYFGKFCQTKCRCNVELCSKKYGCLRDKNQPIEEENSNEFESISSGVGVNVVYLLIGFFSAIFITILFLYLKSRFHRNNVLQEQNRQNQIITTENYGDQGHNGENVEIPEETEDVVPSLHGNSKENIYTEQSVSQMDNAHNKLNQKECGEETEILHVSTFPEHTFVIGVYEDIDDDEDGPFRKDIFEGYNSLLELSKRNIGEDIVTKLPDEPICQRGSKTIVIQDNTKRVKDSTPPQPDNITPIRTKSHNLTDYSELTSNVTDKASLSIVSEFEENAGSNNDSYDHKRNYLKMELNGKSINEQNTEETNLFIEETYVEMEEGFSDEYSQVMKRIKDQGEESTINDS